MHFCNAISFGTVVVDHGLSPCFYDTISAAVLSSFIFVFGTVELLTYRWLSTSMYIFIYFVLTVVNFVSILLENTPHQLNADFYQSRDCTNFKFSSQY